VFGGYEGTDANYANSGRAQSNAFRFGTYVSYSTGGFYSNAIIGAALTGYNVDRPIEWTGFERDASSKPTGGEFFLSLRSVTIGRSATSLSAQA
jgi:autotransporter-like protein